MYDVIVVGMGPAGSTAASELSRRGLRVLGLEWKPLPRYKVCGGGLSARLDTLLHPDYRNTIEDAIYTVRFQFAGIEAFQVTSPEPVAYMVMRDRFDTELVRQARANGVEVRDDERVVAVTDHPDGVEVQTTQSRYHARIVVGADGASSIVARKLCASGPRPVMNGVEAEAIVEQRPESLLPGMIVLDLGMLKGGYAWVFPKSRHLSIGAAQFRKNRNAKNGYERFLRTETTLNTVAPPVSRGHAIPIYTRGRTAGVQLIGERAVLVGDAAHLVDPLFGEGIYYAVLSARLAAESISHHLSGHAPDLRGYVRRVTEVIYPEFQIAARIARILYMCPRLCHRIARRRPEIIEMFYDVLKGRETYLGFYQKAKTETRQSVVALFTAGLLKHSGA